MPQVEDDPNVEQTPKDDDDGRATEEDVGMDNSGDSEDKRMFLSEFQAQKLIKKFKKVTFFLCKKQNIHWSKQLLSL